ncbi:MAG: glycosyltransferase family 9 protein [Calditrichaeota bacterium]|nr:MAG: glycosyltransferase family 9 protein [Calditrichota bacterium]
MRKGEFKKILIIRLSSIGDIILTTPLIRLLRKQFPDAQIDYVTKSRFADLLRYNTRISNLFEFSEPGDFAILRATRQLIYEQHYNAIIDLHKNFRSLILSVRQNTQFTGRLRKQALRRAALVKLGWNRYSEIRPVMQRYIDVAAPLNIQDDGEGTELFIPKNIEAGFDDAHGSSFSKTASAIALAPGAGYFTKKWPVENYQQLALAIVKSGKKCFVLGGPDDTGLGQKVAAVSPQIVDLTGKLSLLESAAALKKMAHLVTNDTGLMHMAEAVKTPVTAIFGSTVRQLGFFPFLQESRVFENLALSCRPCTHVGRHSCPKGHFLCMKSIGPDEIIKYVLS